MSDSQPQSHFDTAKACRPEILDLLTHILVDQSQKPLHESRDVMGGSLIVGKDVSMQSAELDQALSNTMSHDIVVLHQWEQLVSGKSDHGSWVSSRVCGKQRVIGVGLLGRLTVKNMERTSALTRTVLQLAG
jgi:hypothetical protein